MSEPTYKVVEIVGTSETSISKAIDGAIANVASVVSLASVPAIAGYSASKAALFSATQAAACLASDWVFAAAFRAASAISAGSRSCSTSSLSTSLSISIFNSVLPMARV